MSLAIAGICFDYARDQVGTTTVPLRYDDSFPVLLPEWRHGQGLPSVAAYRIDRLGQVGTVLVQLAGDPGAIHLVRAVGRSIAGPLPSPSTPISGLDVRQVAIGPNGFSRWEPFSFATSGMSNGVNVSTFGFAWQEWYGQLGAWLDFDVTSHKIYTVISGPTAPWGASTSDGGSLPRTDLLDFACLWANGARSADEVAARITSAVHSLGGTIVAYDALVGGPHYTLLGAPFFLCNEFLERLRGGPGAGPLVNCSDCATIVSTVANLLGADLWQSKMGLIAGGFRLNPVVSIGLNDWSTLFGGFIFHEVAWTGACREADLVYDACVLVDGDQDPTAEPKTPVLALGTRFGNPGEGGFRDQIAAPESRDICEPQPTFRMRRPVEFGAPSPVDDLPGDLERRVAARVGISAPEPDRVRFEGFDIFGAELQAWRLTRRIKLGTPAGHRGSFQSLAARVSSAPDQVAPLATRPQIVVSIWHAGDDTDQAIRIESIECADGGEAQRRLLRATADIENPNIELWERDTPGESSLRLPDGALALFTRGNHLHILRSVGRRALDVTAEAEGLDDWLMRSGEPEGQAGSVAAFVPAWTRLEMVARSEGARNFSRYVVTPVSRRH